jgi:acetyltransferase-like isoleucine patch superfamily enzyme
VVIAAGARITNSCRFGHFIIVSFNSTIGHDCILENYVSVMPGVNVSGCIHLQQGTYIGTNAAILPGKSPEQLKYLGENSVIGAGAVVVKHAAPEKVYIGSPAKELSRD